MNISLLDKFKSYKNYYHIIYTLLIINIIVLILIETFLYTNKTMVKYLGIGSDNNIVFSKLSYDDVKIITNSKQMLINDNYEKVTILDVLEGIDDYTLKLKVDDFYFDTQSIEVKFIVKEEKLYQFIFNVLKGE